MFFKLKILIKKSYRQAIKRTILEQLKKKKINNMNIIHQNQNHIKRKLKSNKTYFTTP